jgi:tetratricopeptide (TPR) repeat protein
LRVAPDKPSLLHNRAVMLQRAHRHAEALAVHERTLALGLDAAEAHYNRGNTLQSLGRQTEALAAYRQALVREPAHALSLYDLSRLRWRQGDADFDTELRQAIASDPASPLLRPLLPGLHAHLLWRAERYADAADAYRLALQHSPQAAPPPRLLDGLARCLLRLGDIEAGLQAHQAAVAAAPQDAELRAHHSASLLVAGLHAQALAAAQVACDQAPAHQFAQALRVLALRLCGDVAGADAICHAQRFVQVIDLPPPPGFADMAAFNAALAAELRALHADSAAPIDQTLRGGTQTMGDIFEQGHPLVDALKAQISRALDGYIAGLPADTDDPTAHPFLNRRSSGWRFTDSWSSRLTQQGFHTDHVHPHGWISSAYYVNVPEGVADHPQCEGWLQFGRPDLPLAGIDRDSLVQRRVAPQPGRLVLFPSMLWHGTVPFSAPAERLTIAFDVVPV